MTTVDRRNFLTGASAAAACLPLTTSTARSAVRKDKIKIGQIGTGHAHAA